MEASVAERLPADRTGELDMTPEGLADQLDLVRALLEDKKRDRRWEAGHVLDKAASITLVLKERSILTGETFPELEAQGRFIFDFAVITDNPTQKRRFRPPRRFAPRISPN